MPAERGTLRLRVQLVGPERVPVLEHAAQVHATLVAQARAHVDSGAATWWGSDSVLAWSSDEWVKPRPDKDAVKVTRFRAGADLRVKFRDFAALGRWAGEAATLTGVAVTGVDWALTETRRDAVVREVRTAATRDAVERARAYAAALGFTDVRPVALFEAGLRPHVGAGGMAGMAGVAMRGAAAPASASNGIELRPEDIEVTAAVTVDLETV